MTRRDDGLLDGATVPWDLISGRTELDVTVLPTPVRREPIHTAAQALRIDEQQVLEQTRAIARLGLAARDLGHAIAANLRALHAARGDS